MRQVPGPRREQRGGEHRDKGWSQGRPPKGRSPKGRPPKGRPPRGRPPRGRPPQGRRPGGRPERETRGPPKRREVVATGKAADVGLDGRLRVELEPLALAAAEALTRGRGAEVFTPRGESLGNVQGIVGTLERPIAIVRLQRDAREMATDMRGREVFLG